MDINQQVFYKFVHKNGLIYNNRDKSEMGIYKGGIIRNVSCLGNSKQRLNCLEFKKKVWIID
jgi:hypothetical protein